MPEAELEDLLVDKGKHMGHSAYSVRGQVFCRPDLLRLRAPQICVDCIHMTGHCKAMWDCRLYTVCHIHRTPMVKRCQTCGAPLRWFRPAVDVCQCGAYFKSLDDSRLKEASEAVSVAGWIADHFTGRDLDIRGDFSLPNWMPALTLDGLCTLLRAMGAKARGHQSIKVSSQMTESVEFWQEVCIRAIEHLRAFVRTVDSTEIAPVVWEGALEGWALAPVSRTDQQVALKLLREIFTTEIIAHFGSQRAALCQMHLFED